MYLNSTYLAYLPSINSSVHFRQYSLFIHCHHLQAMRMLGLYLHEGSVGWVSIIFLDRTSSSDDLDDVVEQDVPLFHVREILSSERHPCALGVVLRDPRGRTPGSRMSDEIGREEVKKEVVSGRSRQRICVCDGVLIDCSGLTRGCFLFPSRRWSRWWVC